MNAPGSLDSLRRNFPLWMPVLVVLLGLANFIVSPWASTGGGSDPVYLMLLAALVGVMTAEAGVLAVWLVWSEWPLPLKFTLHWLTGLFLFGCWGVGYLVAVPASAQLTRDHRVQDLVITAGCLPAISLAVQTPLWIVRTLFGWRLLRGGGRLATESKLSISGLFVGTTIVAASFGCLRLAGMPLAENANDYWLAWGMAGVALLFASAVVLLPLVVILLRTKRNKLGIGGALAWCLGLGIIIELPLLKTLGAIGAPRAPDAWLTVAVVTVYVASALATVGVPLAIARTQGYRLCFRGDAQRGLAGRVEPS